MKLILTSFVLTVILSSSIAAIARGNFHDPNHPDKCVFDGHVLSEGNHKKPIEGKCLEIDCNKNGYATIITCPPQLFFKSKKKCKDIGYVDDSRPMPECCEKKFQCDDEIITPSS